MDEFQLLELLAKSDKKHVTISNEVIEFGSIIISQALISNYITLLQFQSCVFQIREVLFEDLNKPELSIYFRQCSFHGNIYFTNSKSLKGLKFINTKKISHNLGIRGNSISEFYLKNDKHSDYSLEGNIDISENTLKEKVDLKYLKHISGEFRFVGNVLQTEKSIRFQPLNVTFQNSHLHNAIFSGTDFGQEVRFDRMVLTSNISLGRANFDDCTFGNVYFDFVDFGESAYFGSAKFNSSAQFLGCKNLEKGVFSLPGVSVEGSFIFNNSEFKELNIHHATFKGRTSFVDTKFRKISINQTTFEKPAFFDNINLLDLNICDRKTLRSIKQQLQRTENRIDYNKFKGYELNAYRQELKGGQWKDRFILWLNFISSNHGVNWFQGLKFTLTVGLIFFIPYFISENHTRDFELSYNSLNYFTKGYFNFLIPSYKSPFDNGLTQWYQYFIFLLGKIFISYGIYQTIVSFRKFRI